MDAVEVVASVLSAHIRMDAPGGRCSCGYTVPLGKSFITHQAQAVVAALRAAIRPLP